MKIIAPLAIAAGLTMAGPASVQALSDDCIEQVKADCALFVPWGSAQWASCVENLSQFCDGVAISSEPFQSLWMKNPDDFEG